MDSSYQAVVALMGSTLSRYQADLLSTHFERVLLMLDGDEAGRQGAATIANALTARMPVEVIALDDGNQPDQLRPEKIQSLMSEE
jgi:DNA primase